MDRVTEYAKKVVSGDIIAGELVILACERHLRDLEKSKKDRKFEYKFDLKRSEWCLDFFSFLNHSKGKWAGTPVKLELWQCFCIGSVFGWVNKKTGFRKYRTAYEQVARKNGKSTKLAGVGIIGLVGDGEEGAEVYSAATKKDQARIIFDEAKRMVKNSPYIKKMVSIYSNNLNVPDTNSKFEPLSKDSDSLDGLNVSLGVIDELHAHKTREIFDVIDTATSARTQPIIYIITTAGFNVHGICYEKYDYAIKVLKGVVDDDSFFAYIAQIDDGDDWEDESCWIKANPNLHVSVDIEDLRRKAKQAKEIPAALNNFLTKHLNVWTTAESRWMDMIKWKACDKDIPYELLIGRACYVGLDLSSALDLSSVNFEFPLDDGEFANISHSFTPEDTVQEKIKKDGVPYDAWIREGYMTATPGDVIDQDWIESYILAKSKLYDIREINYDPWNASQFAIRMQNHGLEVVEIRQGFQTLSEPTKDINKLVVSKKLIHGNNPLLNWAMSNVICKEDPAGNIKPDKSKTTFRIDPAVALVNSHVRAMVHKLKRTKSIYEERGIVDFEEDW